jgi:hypothetical protein
LKFSPSVSNAFPLIKTKLPLNKILLLVFKRVLRYQFWKYYFLLLLNTIRYQLKDSSFQDFFLTQISKIGGGAVLLLWANTFSPFGMNRQKRILEWDISPFNYFLPLWRTQYEWRLYQSWRVARSDGEGWVIEWSGSLCLRRRLQFPFNTPMTWFEIHLKTH